MGNPNSGRQVFKRVDIGVTDPLLLLLKIYAPGKKVKDRTGGVRTENRRSWPDRTVGGLVGCDKQAVFVERFARIRRRRGARAGGTVQFGSFVHFLLFAGWLSRSPVGNGHLSKVSDRKSVPGARFLHGFGGLRMRKTASFVENSGSRWVCQKGSRRRLERPGSVRSFIFAIRSRWLSRSGCPERNAPGAAVLFAGAHLLVFIQLSKTTGRRTPTRQGGWTCLLP